MPKATPEKAKKVGVASKSITRRVAASKAPEPEEVVAPVVEQPTPVVQPEPVVEAPKKKYLGKLGTSKVVRLLPKVLNGVFYNEILTAEGTTFLLSDEDLKKQFKAIEE